MWANLSPEEAAAIKELDALPDRAAGIVGATILESRLGDRLKRETADFLINPTNTLHHRMFTHSGPIGSFSARINLGFMLKIYGEKAWRDLDIIREIRNSFAHITGIRSFDIDSVRDRCANLKACETQFSEHKESDGWLISTAESSDRDIPLEMHMQIPNLNARLANPRERYLMCIQYYSIYLMHPFDTLTVHP
jgi:hypothetical protein